MSETIDKAVEALNDRLTGGLDGVVKFVIKNEGAVIIDENGARAGDDEADVTLTADIHTFRGMLDGDVNPTAAFMTGRLRVDGDMGLAMKLGSVFG